MTSFAARTGAPSAEEAEAIERLSAKLTPMLGDRLLASAASRARYADSEAHHAGHLPDLVAQPQTVAEVQAVVRAAASLGVPLVAHGAGTSLEGNAAAAHGGLVVDLSLMNRIVEVRAEDLLCVVEPGVTREALNAELRGTGLFFPVDPGANATLGGMLATRASGTNAVRYGTMRENALALDVVLADGTLLKTGTRARKSAAGYDLTHLFVGSEGTLGLIVGATLRLHGLPETTLAATWDFATLAGAVETVIATMQAGVPMARIELLDAAAMRACNTYAKLDLPERPTLFLEFHGSAAGVAEQVELVQAIGAGAGGGEFRQAVETEARSRLWKARHQALPAARAMVPGAVVWVTDVCVPISHLADAIARAQSAVEAAGLFAPILGHVGDGNFHVFFVLPSEPGPAWDGARAINEAMVAHAVSAGGTSTGEHGIGLGKKAALRLEHGEAAVDVMQRLKAALDPTGLLNPGKLFDS